MIRQRFKGYRCESDMPLCKWRILEITSDAPFQRTSSRGQESNIIVCNMMMLLYIWLNLHLNWTH